MVRDEPLSNYPLGRSVGNARNRPVRSFMGVVMDFLDRQPEWKFYAVLVASCGAAFVIGVLIG